jgi:hypothetical protein
VALFREIERTDSSPARYGEDSFSFLDRVDQKFWQRVRTELERWFAAYPADEASDLRARFRDKHPAQHFAAWWELYLHRLFCQLGFSVDIHPKLEGFSTRPDFRVSRPGAAFLVEAATTISGIVDEDRDDVREAWIMAALDQVHAPDFFVGLDLRRSARNAPLCARSSRRSKPGYQDWTLTLSTLRKRISLAGGLRYGIGCSI